MKQMKAKITADSESASGINYWIVKGKPSQNDFDRFLLPGSTGRWYTRRLPRLCEPGDRLIFWRGTPALEVVGLGEFVGVVIEHRKEDGKTIFEVKYLTDVLPNPIGIAQLRQDAVLGSASFLKSGPAGTVFPLTRQQGTRLYNQVSHQNPKVRGVWPESARAGTGSPR